jgi:hypothetical protein
MQNSAVSDIIAAMKTQAYAPGKVSPPNASAVNTQTISMPMQTTADDYMTKLVKYIPAEIIAVYLFINGIVTALTAPSAVLSWGVFALLLLLTPLYIWRVTNDKALPPAWDQMLVAFISFAVWVFAIGGPFTTLVWYNPLYGSILVALFTLVIPMIRK